MAWLLGGVSLSRNQGITGHSRDTSVWVDLLEDLVDVRRVRLDSLLGPLLAALGLDSGGLSSLEGGSVIEDDWM